MPFLVPTGAPNSPPATNGYVKTRLSTYNLQSQYQVILITPLLADNVAKNITLSDKFWFPGGVDQSLNDATRLLLQFDFRINSAGVLNKFHELNCAIYSDDSLVTLYANLAYTAYEFAVIPAGTWIGGAHVVYEIPITGPNLQISLKLYDSGAGVNSQIQGLQLLGYFTD